VPVEVVLSRSLIANAVLARLRLPNSVTPLVYVTVPCTPLSCWAAECGTCTRQQGQQYPGVPQFKCFCLAGGVAHHEHRVCDSIRTRPQRAWPVRASEGPAPTVPCVALPGSSAQQLPWLYLPTPPVLQCAQRPPGNRHRPIVVTLAVPGSSQVPSISSFLFFHPNLHTLHPITSASSLSSSLFLTCGFCFVGKPSGFRSSSPQQSSLSHSVDLGRHSAVWSCPPFPR
jgi:hypothetical protein